jgi:glycine cleavage system H lipoate-binding protein
MVILTLFAFILLCLAIDAIVQYSKKREAKVPALSTVSKRVFNEALISVPKGVFFDKTHTWAFMEKNGMVKVGIDDFLLHLTGPLSRLKMKTQGEKIRKGEALLTVVQNGKQLTIYAPLTGTIKSVNNQLLDDSGLLNSSPFNEGWVYAIEPANWLRDMQFMFMDEKYREWLKNEFARLKDFLAFEWKSKTETFVPITLQDGGEISDSLLADFGPEVWEEFQIKFIDPSK